jgi:hypothetical protein
MEGKENKHVKTNNDDIDRRNITKILRKISIDLLLTIPTNTEISGIKKVPPKTEL